MMWQWQGHFWRKSEASCHVRCKTVKCIQCLKRMAVIWCIRTDRKHAVSEMNEPSACSYVFLVLIVTLFLEPCCVRHLEQFYFIILERFLFRNFSYCISFIPRQHRFISNDRFNTACSWCKCHCPFSLANSPFMQTAIDMTTLKLRT